MKQKINKFLFILSLMFFILFILWLLILVLRKILLSRDF